MDKGTPTLGELTPLWLQESLGVINEETHQLYGWFAEQFILPRFGERLSVSEEEALSFIEELKARDLSESAIATILRIVRHVLEYGAALGYCEAPEWGITLGAAKRKRDIVILTPQEERQLSDYLISNPSEKHLCLFLMLTTGITIGEAVALRWKDISIPKSEMRVITERGPVNNRKKTTRKITLGERQKIYLRKMASPLPDAYLNSGTSKSKGPAILNERLRRVLDKLVLPPVSPTCLRHTYAVRCIESGMDYETLSRNLGILNNSGFRNFYKALVSEEQAQRLDRERFENRKVRVAPKHVNKGPRDPESTPYRIKIAERRQELKEELDSLEGDLAIIHTLRNADCVQGVMRQGLYSFIEKVLGDDKDGKYLVEYLRCNMRVADMPLRKVTTWQAIRRRVTHGFEKLNKRLDEIYAVEGYDMLGMFRELCEKIIAVAPPAPAKTGPKPKPTVENEFKKALEAIERIKLTQK